MNLINEIFKLQKRILKPSNSVFDNYNYKDQKDFLNSFPEIKDLSERSYFQYKCQRRNMAKHKNIIEQSVSIFIIIILLIFPFRKPKTKSRKINKALFLREGVSVNLIPSSLKNKYSKIKELPLNGKMYLSFKDKRTILKYLSKYFNSPYFIMKNLVKVGIYSKYIKLYNPLAIITHTEYSFSCSFLTQYCRLNDVKHINIMHGEKLFNIRDAFVEYDNFYIWDLHYKQLFNELSIMC